MPPFSKQCLLEASNCNLTFYKTRQLATWLQVSLKCQVQTGFQAYSSEKKWDLFCLLKFQLSLLQLLLIGMLHQNGRPRDWDFNPTRLRSRTWKSGILPIQCLFSKLRQSYAPFRQEVITVIVAQASFSLLDLPWVPKGRLQQLLIREGRGYRNRGGANGGTALRQDPGSHSKKYA